MCNTFDLRAKRVSLRAIRVPKHVSNKRACYMHMCTLRHFTVSKVMLMALCRNGIKLGCLRREELRRTGTLPHCAKNHI